MRRCLILLLALLAGCNSSSGDSAGGEPTIAEKLAVLDGDDAGVPTEYEARPQSTLQPL
jgi:hypothetical protein